MYPSKLRFVVIALLAVGIAGIGTGLLVHDTSASPPSSFSSPPASQVYGPAESPAPVVAKANAPAQANATLPAQNNGSASLGDKLNSEIDYGGVEDARATLSDALDMLSKRYNLNIDINEKAFEIDNLQDAARTPVCDPKPLPPMRARLSTVLRKILMRLPVESGATYLIRRDRIEITTETAVRAELGIPEHRPLLPLVSDTLEKSFIAVSFRELARQSGYNIVVDPRVAEKLETASAELNNIPVDTAVRLLANMAGLSMVRLDNVLYVTTPENAKQLREEQAQINAEKPALCTEPAKKPAK